MTTAVWQPGVRRVLVLGATDTGKSTLCRRLMDEAPEPVVMVDADPGQAGLGPPACVALGLPGQGVERFVFLGVVEPVRRMAALADAAGRLVEAAGARPVVINTCGFIRGAGQALQMATVRAVRPDVVVCLERKGEAADLRRALAAAGARVLALPSSPEVRRKSQAARRRLRAEGLETCFA